MLEFDSGVLLFVLWLKSAKIAIWLKDYYPLNFWESCNILGHFLIVRLISNLSENNYKNNAFFNKNS